MYSALSRCLSRRYDVLAVVGAASSTDSLDVIVIDHC